MPAFGSSGWDLPTVPDDWSNTNTPPDCQHENSALEKEYEDGFALLRCLDCNQLRVSKWVNVTIEPKQPKRSDRRKAIMATRKKHQPEEETCMN